MFEISQLWLYKGALVLCPQLLNIGCFLLCRNSRFVLRTHPEGNTWCSLEVRCSLILWRIRSHSGYHEKNTKKRDWNVSRNSVLNKLAIQIQYCRFLLKRGMLQTFKISGIDWQLKKCKTVKRPSHNPNTLSVVYRIPNFLVPSLLFWVSKFYVSSHKASCHFGHEDNDYVFTCWFFSVVDILMIPLCYNYGHQDN